MFGWRGVLAVKQGEGEEEEEEEASEEEEEVEEEVEEEMGTARPFFPFLFFVALVDDMDWRGGE